MAPNFFELGGIDGDYMVNEKGATFIGGEFFDLVAVQSFARGIIELTRLDGGESFTAHVGDDLFDGRYNPIEESK